MTDAGAGVPDTCHDQVTLGAVTDAGAGGLALAPLPLAEVGRARRPACGRGGCENGG